MTTTETRVPSDATEQVWSQIQAHGLEANVAELDARGFTIIEPGRAAPMSVIEELRAQLIEVAQRRTGVSLNAAGAVFGDGKKLTQKAMHHMLLEGEAFEQAVLNPMALSLIEYLLGRSCVLSGLNGLIKGPGEDPLPLHTDNGPGMPDPFSPYAQVANATWLLSDYSLEQGSLCFVPGSHRLCRNPTRLERVPGPGGNEAAIPVTAPAGSLVVWHGHLWHGAFPRQVPGVRMTLVAFYTRMFLRPQEDYANLVDDALLARNPERLRSLVGRDHPFPVGLEGADYGRIVAAHRAALNHHA